MDIALAFAGASVLAGMAWLIVRRQRRATDGAAAEAKAGRDPESPAPIVQDVAAPALERRASPRAGLIGVAGKKRLIRALMSLRTVAGGASMLAAVAIVVFWSIEALDPRSGETGLNMPLVALLAGAWAVSWGSGRLANMLHRAFFGRVHPKFDT